MQTPDRIFIPKPNEFCKRRMYHGPAKACLVGWSIRSFDGYPEAEEAFCNILFDLVAARGYSTIPQFNDDPKVSTHTLASVYRKAAGQMGYELDPKMA